MNNLAIPFLNMAMRNAMLAMKKTNRLAQMEGICIHDGK